MNAAKAFAQKAAQAIPKGGGGGEGPQGGGAGIASLLLLGAGAFGLSNSMVTIQPGHKGLVYNRWGGIDEKTQLTEGLNFVVPWFQRALVYDIRTR